MNYLRWLLKQAFGKDPALIIPCLVMSILVVGLTYMIHIAVGVVFTIFAISVWGTFLYAYLSDIFRNSYERYQREKNRGQ